MPVVSADGGQWRDGQPQGNRHQHGLHVSDGLYMYLRGKKSEEQN